MAKLGKLGKTEERILDRLRTHGTYAASRSSGSGAHGGDLTGGTRAFDACLKLVERGIAVKVGDIVRYTVWHRGNAEYCADITIRRNDP